MQMLSNFVVMWYRGYIHIQLVWLGSVWVVDGCP